MNITTHAPLSVERLPGQVPIKNKTDEVIVKFYSNYRYWILDFAETLINGKGIKQFYDLGTASDGTPLWVNDAGYAFLALINGYFDMIGQLSGSDNDQYDCYRRWDRSKHKFESFNQSKHGARNWLKWDSAQKKTRKQHKPQTDRLVWYGLTVVFYDEFKAKNGQPQTDRRWAKFCYYFYTNTRNPVAHTTFPGRILVTRTIPTDITREYTRNGLRINLPHWYEKIAQHFDQYALRIRFPKTTEDKELRKRFLKRYKRLIE